MRSVSASVSAELIGKSLRFFASLRLCGNTPYRTKISAVLWRCCLIAVCGFLAFLLIAHPAFSQTPYLGGKGDGYASQFTQISAVQQSIAPAWMRVYPSPVRSGEEMVVTVFDVKAAAHAELYDVLGKRIALTEPAAGLGKVRLRMPTAGLAAGCYLLRVIRDEEAFTQKVIVWSE